jgi:hypothetical protein
LSALVREGFDRVRFKSQDIFTARAYEEQIMQKLVEAQSIEVEFF